MENYGCSMRRKVPSAPSELLELTPYTIIITWLSVLVDIIAIAARIAIILPPVHHRANCASEKSADYCTGASPIARKNGARESAGARADHCPGSGPCDRVIVPWIRCAAAQRQAGDGGGRNEQTFHMIVLQSCPQGP